MVLEKEKERLELEKKKEEEERKRQEEIKEEEERKQNVFSFERIEKSGLHEINLNNELNNDLFIDEDSQNSDEDILNLFGNKNNNKNTKEEIESINNNNNYPINQIESKNEENMNIAKNDFNVDKNYNNNLNIIDDDDEVEHVLLTQQRNKNTVLKNNIDKPHNRRIQSVDYDNFTNKKNTLTISTDINIPYIHSNNDLSSEKIILSYNNNGSQSERRIKSKTFIKNGENIIKGNKRQISAFYGKNYNIPITISSLNENKELSKKKKLIFASKVQKNQENLVNNQIMGNAKLIKKIEKMTNYNYDDYNSRRKYDN